MRDQGYTPEYLRGVEKSGSNELAITARFKLGNEARGYRYWMKEEDRKYRLCAEGEETFEYIFEKCKITGNDKDN